MSVRGSVPTLRYGRFYMRPVSGDDRTFGVSPYPGGVLAFSRILSDSEVMVVANTNPGQQLTVSVIVDSQINQQGTATGLLYSNKQAPSPPGAVSTLANTVVNQPGGGSSTGTVSAVHVALQPLEVQIVQAA